MNAFFRSVVDVLSPVGRCGSRKATLPGRYRPHLERLEDRLVLAPVAPMLLSISDATVTEGDAGERFAVFNVSLTGHNHATTIGYATADGTATLADHDYRYTAGTLTFRAGQQTRTIRVPVIGDARLENDETFAIHLSLASSGNSNGISMRDHKGLGTIRNDDHGILVDDFSDGDDAGWTQIDFTGGAAFDASSGAYRLSTAGALPSDDPSVGTMAATWEASRDNRVFGNGIVGGTVRANTQGTTAGFILRGNTTPGSDHDYGFFGSTSFGTFYIERFDINAGGQTILAMADPGRNPFAAGEDYHVEGGVWRDRIWMRAWKSGESRPVLPQLMVRDSTFGPEDGTLLCVIAFFDPSAVTGPVQVDATFDDITFTPMPTHAGRHSAGEDNHQWLDAFATEWSGLADLRPSENSEPSMPHKQVGQSSTHQLTAPPRELSYELARPRKGDGIFESVLIRAMDGMPGSGSDSLGVVDHVFADEVFTGMLRGQLQR